MLSDRVGLAVPCNEEPGQGAGGSVGHQGTARWGVGASEQRTHARTWLVVHGWESGGPGASLVEAHHPAEQSQARVRKPPAKKAST